MVQLSYHFPGRWEVVGRYSRLYAAEGTDPTFVEEVKTRGKEAGAGLNCYLNQHRMKVQTSLIGRFSEAWEADTYVLATQLDTSF